MSSFKTTLIVLTITTIQLLADRAIALPTVVETAQYTDRFLPTLTNTAIPPGDNLQIFAIINTTDPEGSSAISVTAKQGDTVVTLQRFATPTTASNFYWGFIEFDPSLTGAWEIVPKDSTGTGPSAFANALAEPELLPYVESITPQGSPLGASVAWTRPNLNDFDVDWLQVRIVQVTPRSEVFVADFLPADTASFQVASGVLTYGREYVYNIGLYDSEGAITENRSVAQSAPFRVVLPGDYSGDGTVGPEDYNLWKAGFGSSTSNADGNRDGIIDAADYTIWRDHLGNSINAGIGGGSALPSAAPLSPAVPEPSAMALATWIVAALAYGLRALRSVSCGPTAGVRS